MKDILILFFTTLLLLSMYSCSIESTSEKNTTPEHIKQKAESIIKSKDFTNEYFSKRFVGFDWNFNSIEHSDSIIYPYTVIYERGDENISIKHLCIVKMDTVTDVIRYTPLFKDWVSLMPILKNVRDEDWWQELSSKENIHSLEYDHRKLELLNESENTWREVFIGNVRIVIKSDTILTDTLYWNPRNGSIEASDCKIINPKGTFNGRGFFSDSNFNNWHIGGVLESKQIQLWWST